jgi:hypothetical protein
MVVAHKTDFVKFDRYIETLYNTGIIELNINEDFSEFENASLDESITMEDTMTLLVDFIDDSETPTSKEKLKTLLKSLYIEAQNI